MWQERTFDPLTHVKVIVIVTSLTVKGNVDLLMYQKVPSPRDGSNQLYRNSGNVGKVACEYDGTDNNLKRVCRNMFFMGRHWLDTDGSPSRT